MKKMRIILLVVVAIIILAGFPVAEAMAPFKVLPSKHFSPPDWVFEEPTDWGKLVAFVMITISIIAIVWGLVDYLAKIDKQQKQILENQRKG